jgi:hypothetical protein
MITVAALIPHLPGTASFISFTSCSIYNYYISQQTEGQCNFTDWLHGCEALSLTLKEEHKLGMYEKRSLRILSQHNKKEVTRG